MRFRYAPRMQSMRMNDGPMVGLTWTDDIVARSAAPGENALRYMSLLSSAGLTPVLITPKSSTTILARLDGLVVPGGPDVAPSRYEQEPGPHMETSIENLDELEFEFVTAARARSLPILGICRGQQVLNVALGGTLHQHVDHPRWGADPTAPIHDVQILDGTYLRHILGIEVAAVNSGHHQAVDRLAPSLRCAAVSSDGCVEALEAPDLLLLAVQWHPEEMAEAQSSRRLVEGFARWITG
jgi:putative glutamine amidotransferase